MPRQLAGVYDLNYLASAFSTCSTTFGPSHILHFLLYRSDSSLGFTNYVYKKFCRFQGDNRSDSSLGFTNYVYKKFCRFPGDTTQVIKPQNSYKFSRGSYTNLPRSERYLTPKGSSLKSPQIIMFKMLM
jgi:hypothetical protein